MNTTIHQTLVEISKKKTRVERIEAVQKAVRLSLSVAVLLELALDPTVKFYLPENVEYTPQNIGTELWSGLHHHVKKMKRLTTDEDIRDEAKRLKFFQSILESIHIDDAKLLTDIVNNKFPFKSSITLKLVQEALPGFLDGQVT